MNEGIAAHAIDGRTDGCRWAWNPANTLTHTNEEVQPWWKTELVAQSLVKTVKVYNRADCCSERLANYVVRVGDNADFTKNA